MIKVRQWFGAVGGYHPTVSLVFFIFLMGLQRLFFLTGLELVVSWEEMREK